MITAEDSLDLISALEGPLPLARVSELLARPEVSLMFPAWGLTTAEGLQCLEALANRKQRERLDQSSAAVTDYFEKLISRREQFEQLVNDLRGTEVGLTDAAFRRTREFLPASCSLGRV